jgi:hypothetical protein
VWREVWVAVRLFWWLIAPILWFALLFAIALVLNAKQRRARRRGPNLVGSAPKRPAQ